MQKIIPVDRRTAGLEDGYNPNVILHTWTNQVENSDGLFFLLDLDENLFDTATHWVRLTNRVLSWHAKISLEKLPPPSQVFKFGGPSKYYHRFFPETFTYQTYEAFADEMRHRFAPNVSGAPMTKVLQRVVNTLINYGNLLGCITARPASAIVKKATEQQLSRCDILMPVIYKPVDVSLAEATNFKLELLKLLAKKTRGKIVLFDDSLTTATAILEFNASSGSPDTQLIQLVNISGALTSPIIELGEQTENIEHGVLFMQDWDSLEDVLQKIT